MNSSRRILLTAFLAIVFSITAFSKSSSLTRAIDSLDLALLNLPALIEKRVMYVDSLKKSSQLTNIIEVADAYQGFNNDSAIHYYTKAIVVATASEDTSNLRYVLPRLARRLAMANRFRDAFLTLDTIDLSNWSRRDKINYFSSLSHISVDAVSGSPSSHPFHSGNYKIRAIDSLDSLLTLISDKNARSLILAQKFFIEEEPVLALGELKEVIKNQDPYSTQYGIASNMLASYYKDKPDKSEEYLYYLTISAISDANHANCEAVSLIRLGEAMLDRGDLTRAFRYLSTAGELIGQSNSILYGSEIAPSLSKFASIWEKRYGRSKTVFIIVIILLSVAVIVISVAFWIAVKRRRNVNQKVNSLSDSVSNRELYISKLIDLCGVYVEGLEEFNKFVGRKLKVNQTHDLMKMIESGKLLQESSDRFFEVFDEAVLKIYPDFIQRINSLLLSDKQVSLLPGDRLSPELRIVAFMQLGVTDTPRLAKFLGLSVNTVYTYRNRMKNRAKDRAGFEKAVIDVISKAEV